MNPVRGAGAGSVSTVTRSRRPVLADVGDAERADTRGGVETPVVRPVGRPASSETVSTRRPATADSGGVDPSPGPITGRRSVGPTQTTGRASVRRGPTVCGGPAGHSAVPSGV